ncbi:MAG: hypothetical protein KBT48_05720 [Firmicutes bacterium]|nr:hypothetical protein [Bacillota bacterium]
MKTNKSPLVKTLMQRHYLINFCFRLSIFLLILLIYLIRKDILVDMMTRKFTFGITPLHVLWLGFMIMMIGHIRPKEIISMAWGKSQEKNFHEVPNYSALNLLKFVQDQNYKAWLVLLIWLCFNAIFGFLYVMELIDSADLLMLTVFYFLSDYICILFFCPFQTYIMKNRCCVNCRIFDWGHFMMFTPMLFIRNFFSWSLFFTSLIVLIRWELIYAKYPERFWFGSNKTIQCANCKDKTCRYKRLN